MAILKRMARVGFLVAGCVTLIGVTVFVVQDRTLKLQPIEFILDEGASHERILFEKISENLHTVFRKIEGKWIWSTTLDEVLATVQTDSRVKAAHVFRRYPNRILVVIQPQTTAANFLDGDGFLHPVATDGSLLPPVYPSQAPDRPLLRGKKFAAQPQLRERVVQLLGELPETGMFSQSTVSEIHYDEKTGFEFTLIGSGVTVKVGDDSLLHKANQIEKVLMYLQSQRIKGRVIDARFAKKVVVKLRKRP